MGFNHVEAALQAQLPHQTGIDMGTLKLVLIAICQHASNDANYCFPSTRRLAKMTHLSKSTCAKAVEYLNCMGCFLNYSKGDGSGSSSYIVDLERLKGWRIDWNLVRHVHEGEETGVRHVDEVVGENTEPRPQGGRSVRHVDTSSATWTPRPPADPNQSFDRLVNHSEGSGRVVSPPAKGGEANQSKSKPVGSLVASATPKAKPDIWGTGAGKVCCKTWDQYEVHAPGCPKMKRSLVGSVDDL